MAIFRTISFYIAMAGIVLVIVLIKKLTAQRPEPVYLPPAVNPYEMTIAASGIIEAIDKNIEIGVPHSALVKEVCVTVGDTVQEGRILFRLDDRELQAQLLVQKANASVLHASLLRLKDQLARLESIEDPRAISQEELQTRRHDVAIAEAELAAAEAQITHSILLIEQLNICAPQGGMILQNSIRKGEYISTGNSPAMILGDIKKLQIRADIDEQNASLLLPLSSATAFPKNQASLKIPLRFERIEPYVIPKRSLTGASDERVDTRVLQVIYSFEKAPEVTLYVGQQVDIFIEKALPKTSGSQEETPGNA